MKASAALETPGCVKTATQKASTSSRWELFDREATPALRVCFAYKVFMKLGISSPAELIRFDIARRQVSPAGL